MMKRPDRRNAIYFGFDEARARAEQGDIDAALWICARAADALRAGDVPADMAAWLADRLAEVASGSAPDAALMVRRRRGRPRRSHTVDRRHEVFSAVEAMSGEVSLERAYAAVAAQFHISQARVKQIHLRWRAVQRDAWREGDVWRDELAED